MFEEPQQQPVQHDIELDPTPSVPLPPPVAEDRAFRAKVGMPWFSKSYDQILTDLKNGMDQKLRDQAAAEASFRSEAEKQDALGSVMAKLNRNLTPDEENMVRAYVVDRHAKSPASVFEEYYSKEFMDTVARTGSEDGWLKEFKDQQPDTVRNAFTTGTQYSSKQQWLRTQIEDGDQVAKSQSWLGWGVDQAKNLFPFYWNLKTRGNVPGMSGLEAFGTGTQMSEESKALFRLPMPEFQSAFLKKYKQLQNDNPSLAQEWARAMLGQSSSEEALNNLFTTLDIPTIYGGVKLAIKAPTALRSLMQTREAIKSAIKYVENNPGSSRAVMEEAAGNVQEGFVQRATTEITNEMAGNPPRPESFVERNLPSIFSRAIDQIRNNPGRLTTEAMNRLIERYQGVSSDFVEAITKGIKIDRLPAVMATERAIKGITESLKSEYPELRNNLLDIKLRWDEKANIYYADYYLGKNGLALFDSESSAKRWISEQGLQKMASIGEDGVKESQQGVKYYVGVSKPLRETADVVRDALLATEHTKTPNSWLSSYAGWLGSIRTPEETLSLEQRFARKIATYAPAWLRQVAEDSSKEIKELRKGAWVPYSERKKRWEEWQRVTEDSIDNSRRTGSLYETPGQLDAAYQRVLNRLPDEQETAAYFAWKRSEEMDWALRNYQAYKELSRTGAQTHTVFSLDSTKETAKSIPSKGVTFNGHRLKELPNNDDVIIIMKNGIDDTEITTTGSLRNKVRQLSRYNEDIKEGRKLLLELSNPSDRPFEHFSDATKDVRARYVLIDKAMHQERTLDWNQVKRQPPKYEYDHYAVQAILRRDPVTGKVWYEGDKIIAGFNINAMGRDVVKKLEQVRLHLQDGNEAAARDYLKANPIGMDFNDIHKWFKGDVTSEGLPIPPRLDLGERIQIVPRTKTTLQQDSKGLAARVGEDVFKDGTKEGYGRFFPTGADTADIMSLRNEGTKANPLYKNNPVKYLDPVTSINRALNKSINDVYMNDYKIASVEHWLEEAKHYLKASESEIRSSPYYHFFHPDFQNLSGEDLKTINNLKAAQFQIRQLLGVKSEHETWMHAATQKLADSVYSKTGSQKAAELIPSFLLPATRDPFGFIRGMTFHAKLGLFNPVQIWVQAQSFVTIMGVAGLSYAAPGAKAALLSGWAGVNAGPEILAHMDKLASKQLLPGTKNFRPGEWKEAYELLRTTGFHHVGGEYALRDNPTGLAIIKDGKREFLDWGSMFFRGTEKAVRDAAWFTAYKEYREAKPFGKIGQAELKGILERADTLYTNMSRASSSTLHTGILSIPSQFLSYQLRLTELFMGKRLTQTEKARLFATYGVMYGFPTAFGVTGLPLGDYIKKWSQEGGYKMGDSYINDAVTQGIPSLMLSLVTGGNKYNVGERYGPQGFGDLLRSDETWWAIVGGAAGSTISNSIASMDGFTKVLLSGLRGDGVQLPLKVEDFLEPLQEISTVGSARRLWMAINTGQWLSKKEVPLTEASPTNALFMTLTGLQPNAVSDIYTMKWTRDQEKQAQQDGLNYFIKEVRRSLRAAKDNPNDARDYMTRAFAGLRAVGYPEEKMTQAISIAMKGYETMVDKVTWDYLTRDVPEYRKPVAQESMKRFLNNK